MRTFRRFVVVVACALAGVLWFAPPALAAGTWTATASLNTPRADHTATLLRDGKVLVAGGGDLGGGLPDPTLGERGAV